MVMVGAATVDVVQVLAAVATQHAVFVTVAG
jgi:hypothetical protein